MKTSSKPESPNKSYKVATCRDGYIEQIVTTKEQKDTLNLWDVDFHYDDTDGQVFIKGGKGRRKHPKNFPFGPCAWELLERLLWAAGDFVNVESENYVSAMVRRIRQVFDDSFKDQYFIITRRNPKYSIRWNPARSWRLIRLEDKDESPEEEAGYKS